MEKVITEKPLFTPEEISIIDKTFGFMVFDWAKSLITHVLTMAREQGVEVVYMNTPESLSVRAPVSNDDKADYFYDKIPPTLGFKKEQANLRRRGNEELWAYRFNEVTAGMRNVLIKLAKRFTLEQLPSTKQGAFLGIIGKKPFYDDQDLNKVLEVLKQKKEKGDKGGNKGKLGSTFYYDWDSRKNSSQLFDDKKQESVVLQRLDDDIFNKYISHPVLGKFLSFLVSQYKHFDASDVMGFALILKHSSKIWVINEIQTDCINKYMDIRNKYYKGKMGESKKGVDWTTLKDMLQTGNRSKWIAKMEANEPLKQQVMQDPSIINQLPNDTQDIDQWIKDQQADTGDAPQIHQQLRQYLAETNFSTRIFKC
jgi:hypothetical protein